MIINAPQPIKRFIKRHGSEMVLCGLFANGKTIKLCSNLPADFIEWIMTQTDFDYQMSSDLDKNCINVK